MRALVVHAGNMYGGTECVLETLARERHLCPGLDLYFALCCEGRLSEALRSAGVAVEVLGHVRVTRPHLVVRARYRFAHLVRRHRPDVIITQAPWSHAIFAPVARRLDVPLAIWVHDLLSGSGWLDRLAARWQPDLLVCNSRTSARVARNMFPDVPAEVVHGPLTFSTPSASRQGVRQERSTADETVAIVHVGRMVALKGHRMLIDALARLGDVPVPWTCWLVGGAQRPEEVRYERSLRDWVSACGLEARVRFLGMRDDVADILGGADVYCQPNEEPEAFGLSLVEALRAGLPVITTNLGGAREIVTDRCGRLVPPGDADALATALRGLLTDSGQRRQLGAAGPARAWELCNPAECFKRLNAALERVRIRAVA